MLVPGIRELVGKGLNVSVPVLEVEDAARNTGTPREVDRKCVFVSLFSTRVCIFCLVRGFVCC